MQPAKKKGLEKSERGADQGWASWGLAVLHPYMIVLAQQPYASGRDRSHGGHTSEIGALAQKWGPIFEPDIAKKQRQRLKNEIAGGWLRRWSCVFDDLRVRS